MFNPTFYPVQQSSDITLIGDRIKLKSLLILERSISQSSEYTFIFPSSAGSTGQALFWSGNETTFRGIAIADVATLQTSLNTINTTLNALGTAAFQATSYFALSGHVHPDATTLISGFMSGSDKVKINALGTASTKNTGTTNDTIPLIGVGDKLSSALIPDINSTNNAAFTINADATNTGSDRSLILSTSNQTSSYTLALPPTVGTANQGLIISSVSGSVVSLGWGSSGSGFSSVVSHSTASININLASGSMVAITLSQNTTIASITGIPSGSQGAEFTILCTQNSTGNYTLSFPSGTTLTGAISAAPNSTSVVKVFSFNSGTSWEAIVIKPLPVSGGTTLWTPAQIATLLWLDASDSSTISLGSGVSQWSDKSGNSRNASQSTASAQPALISNGLNSLTTIRLDGSNDSLNLASAIATVRFAFVICKWTSQGQGAFAPIFGGDNSNYDWNGSDFPYTDLFSGFTNTNILNGEKRINGVVTSGNLSRYTNFTIHCFSTLGNVLIGHFASDRYFSGRFSNIEYAEIVLLSSVPSNSIIQKLEGYGAHKWGLQTPLASDHPYKNSAPTV